jgi:RNA polymerase sigma-70 factor (ECF subfamily)
LAKGGEQVEDFEKLYRDFYPQVNAYLLKLTGDAPLAEELTQETFFKVFKKLGAYRGDCKFSVWACSIAKNTYFSYLKKHRRLTFIPDGLADESPTPDERLADKELCGKVRSALETLGEPYRGVFGERVFGELPFSEIAKKHGRTESWARVTYHRAKNMIKESIKTAF